MGEFGIGQPVPRTEDPRLLRGGGQYGDDLTLANQAHGYILRSPHAHAKINSIDTTAAKAAPGVLAVLTGDDWNEEDFGAFPVMVPRQKRDGSPMHPGTRTALPTDRVRLVGDDVAFVVAETLTQAKVSAICESIERYSGVFAGDEARICHCWSAACLPGLPIDVLHQ